MNLLIFLILQFLVISARSEESANFTCIGSLSVNLFCDVDHKIWPVSDCQDQTAYFDCMPNSQNESRLVKFRCPPNSDSMAIFDLSLKKCTIENGQRSKRQNGQIGSACFFNTDCLSGMYCNAGRCICLSTYIQRENFCYEKINPGQSGCIYNEQCSGVWAKATCVNGQCQCPHPPQLANPLIPVQTRDGIVCAADNYCPLPIDDGFLSVLEPTIAVCTSSTDCEKASSMTVPGSETIGDLYECSAVTACCPNRAYTCSLPMGAPPSTGTGWWYNSATGQCQQFLNGINGLHINSNNFATLDHCQTYCGSICPRANPQYGNGKIALCSGNSGCDNNHQCTTIGSQQRCCPKANFVCGRNGGLANVPSSQITEFNAGFQASVFSKVTTTTRYYYDSQTRQCSSFAYLGSGGNFNNFLTQADCQNYCVHQVLCSKGSPLSDSNGQNQRCSPGVTCPVTHTCTNSVCCPTRQTICSQMQQQGTCLQFSSRFWYNSVTKQCEQFTFSGCQGNDNNFLTLLECQNFCKATTPEPQCPQGKALRDSIGNFMTCSSSSGISNQCPINYECHFDGSLFGCCPTKAFTCSASTSSGVSCGPSSLRWSFDSRLQTCSSFTYFGCDGNSNNFPSREQCEVYCGAPACPNGGQPLSDSSNGRIRLCSTLSPCPKTHDCTLFSIGSSPTNYCCPTKTYICTQPPDIGQSCSGVISSVTNSPLNNRFYFSPTSKSCQSLTSNGCGGNANQFQNQKECLNFCTSAACSNGQIVYVNPNTQNVLICDSMQASGCPTGYTCQNDPLWQRNVCCGSTDMGVCPSSERAYVEARTGEAKICLPNLVNSCPSPYLCRLSTLKNRYYCCAPLAPGQCSSGYAPYLTPGTNEPVVCPIGVPGTVCPSGYTCQTLVAGGYQGYCCTSGPLCPIGYTVLQTATAGAQTCTMGAFSFCPNNYQCLATNLNSTNGYCCTNILTNSDLCTTGTAYLLNNAPVVCNALSTSGCPIGYQCQLHSATNTNYCCSSSRADLCPSGTVYKINSIPQVCSGSNANACPSGYACMTSTTIANVSYCCSRIDQKNMDVCGLDSSPYENSGSPLSCDPGRDLCPSGYTCQFYALGNTYYCCKTSAGLTGSCPKGGTNTNKNCSPNVPKSCLQGQTCQYIPANTRYQCCQESTSLDLGTCLENRPSFIDPVTGSSKVCGTSFSTGLCPLGYSCQLSTTNVSICCATPIQTSPRCPAGLKLHLTLQNRPQSCENSFCPSATVCSVTSNGKRYCCRSSAGLQCLNNRRPYINPSTGTTELCRIANDQCPQGYSCELSQDGQTNICCSTIDFLNTMIDIRQCPNGGRPFLYPPTQSPLACTPSNDRCPSGYACLQASNRQYYCCSVGLAVAAPFPSMTIAGCPIGTKPLRALKRLDDVDNEIHNTNRIDHQPPKIQECNPRWPAYTCPQPYRCVYSSLNARFQCCADNFQWFDIEKWRLLTAKRSLRCPPYYANIDGECTFMSRFYEWSKKRRSSNFRIRHNNR